MADEHGLQDAPAGGTVLQPGTKMLLRSVYIMAVVLALLLFGLIGGIVWKASQRGTPKAAETPAQFDLGLALDETISHVTLAGDRLAVTTASGIVIVDLRKNAVTARIRFRPQ